MKEKKMNPILGELIGATVFWLSSAVLKDSIAAAMNVVSSLTVKYADRVNVWLRRDLVGMLRPVFWLFAGLELAIMIFADIWIDNLSVTTDDGSYWWFKAAAWVVFGLCVVLMIGSTWGVRAFRNWPVLLGLINDSERADRLIGDITTSLRLNSLRDSVRDHLREERDRLVDTRNRFPTGDARRNPFNVQIEEIDVVLAFNVSPEDRSKYAVDRLTRASGADVFNGLPPEVRQRSIDAELVRLDDVVRQRLINDRGRLEADIVRIDGEIDTMRAGNGRAATGRGIFAVLVFLLAPYLMAFLVLGSSLCLSMLSGADLIMLFPVGMCAFFLFAMGVAAHKLVTGLFAKLTEVADTVIDKTLDALIMPLLAAGLVGTTLANVRDKFGKVDLPIKEVGEALKKATTPVIQIGWSIFIWCVLIPHWFSFILVFLSGVFNYYIAYRRESVGLGDEAKTHLKNVVRLEQKVLTPVYIFWLVMIAFYIACTFSFMRDRMNYAIGWANDLLSLNGWGIAGSIMFGIVLLVIASSLPKDGVGAFLGRVLRVLGTAGIVLPLFGLAAWMANHTAHVPTVDELAPMSTTAAASVPVAEAHEPDGFDRAAAAAGRTGPTTGHPEDGFLGGADALAARGVTVRSVTVSVTADVSGGPSLGDTGDRSDVPSIPTRSSPRTAPAHRSGGRDCSGLVPSLRAALEARGQCR